jgi:hypothetical protein
VSAGRRITRAAMRPQAPIRGGPGRTLEGQNATRPKIASRAGSSVSPASSIIAMPIPSG